MLTILVLSFYALLWAWIVNASPRCSMYGNCGRKSIFEPQLPCVVGEEFTPSPISADDSRLLVDICGPQWGGLDYVCCTKEQMLSLSDNLKKAQTIISSCPACKQNFVNLFCQFTCSPNQRTFVDVKKTERSDIGELVVSELDFYLADDFAIGFFDSCKNVKFSATNGYAMDLIGGSAKSYQEFLKFLGDKKPMIGGSPFQINFRFNANESHEELLRQKAYACNDTVYKCACADCPDSCPTLDKLPSNDGCVIGDTNCFSYWTSKLFMATVAGIIIALGLKRRSKYMALRQTDNMEENSGSDNLFEEYPTTRYPLNDCISQIIGYLAQFCIENARYVVIVAIVFVFVCTSFIIMFAKVETDPINLWVSKDSEDFIERQYYDEHFGPFYRVEQIFIVNDTGPVLSYDNLKWWFTVEEKLTTTTVQSSSNLTYQDLCLRPTEDSDCVVMSLTQYFDGVLPPEEKWMELLESCTASPVTCLPSFQQPLKSNALFSDNEIFKAKSFMVTLLLSNHTESAIEWEKNVEQFLLGTEVPNGLRMSFSTEMSLEQELNGNNDILIIAISYFLMFVYASWALKNKVGKMRFMLGFAGILIACSSVLVAAGLLSILGLKSTLIIAEVIPFLILAIGVDNIFLITAEYDDLSETNSMLDIETRVLLAVRRCSPSIFTAFICEAICFMFATLVAMPAVRNFAIYCVVALTFNFLLQGTVYVSILTIYETKFSEYLSLEIIPNTYTELRRKARWFLSWKRSIVGTFALFALYSLSLVPYVEVGLDQKIAIPQNSYLVDYFEDVASYLNVGPPVYFVIQNLDFTNRKNQQKVCGKFTSCNLFSLANILEQERNRSSITEPASVWFEDFMMFMNPELDQCCRLRKGSHDVCPPFFPPRRCTTCLPRGAWDSDMTGFPEGDEFMDYFDIWINSPSDPCPLGGKAPYSNSIIYNNTTIISSVIRTAHSPLRSQEDYIRAYMDAKRIASEIEDIDVFAYSPFYVFFAQYPELKSLTLKLIFSTVGSIFVLSWVFLGSLRTAMALSTTVSFIILEVYASMAITNVPLNAVTLVNLIICVGLAFEFCFHIAKSFTMVPVGVKSDGNSRSWYAMSTVGMSVFKGISMTKFIGVTVLAFAHSKIFQILYFRLWITLIILSSVHSLVFLPAALSILGGRSYVDGQSQNRLVDVEEE